jgi:hypothetical protein
MKLPVSIKPAIWGAVGGAITAIVIGFAWGGWVTGGAVGEMEAASAESAIVTAFMPLCVAKAEQQPEQILLLKQESTWERGSFVVKAGWVDHVSEKYRSAVAKACAVTVAEGLEVPTTKPSG